MPTFKNTQFAQSGGATTTVAVTKPTNLIAGDLLVVFNNNLISGNNIATFPTANWRSLNSLAPSGTTGTSQVALKVADSTDVALASFSFALSTAAVKVVGLTAISNPDPAAPDNALSSLAIPNSTTHNAPSVTPLVSRTLLLVLWMIKADSATLTSPDVTNIVSFPRTNLCAGIGETAGPSADVASGTKAGIWSLSGAGVAYNLAVAGPATTDETPPAVPTGLTVVRR